MKGDPFDGVSADGVAVGVLVDIDGVCEGTVIEDVPVEVAVDEDVFPGVVAVEGVAVGVSVKVYLVCDGTVMEGVAVGVPVDVEVFPGGV